MHDVAFDPATIAADAVTLAELHGGTGHESLRIDWLQRRGRAAGLEAGPGLRLSAERLDARPAGPVPFGHPVDLAPGAARD